MPPTDASEPREKLIRLRANRRGLPVDLRVHFEISRQAGCDTYRIIAVEDSNTDPSLK